MRIGGFDADDDLVAIARDFAVVAQNDIQAGVTRDVVLSVATQENVVATAAEEIVGAAGGRRLGDDQRHRGRAVVADDDVVAEIAERVADQLVTSSSAEDDVVACSAEDRVLGALAVVEGLDLAGGDVEGAVVADDPIGALVAGDVVTTIAGVARGAAAD